MLEKLKKGLSAIIAVIAAVLFFLLKRQQQKTAEAETHTKVTEGERVVDETLKQMDSSAADYATKRAKYDELRKRYLPKE